MNRRTVARLVLLPALALAVCSWPALAGRQIERGPKVRGVPAIKPDAATTLVQPNLTYCGGRVLSQAQIVAVLWGTPDAPAAGSSCTGSFQTCLDNFYKGFVQSAQFSWLDEYQTTIAGPDGSAGTNQHIMQPTYYGSVVITPSNTAKVIGESIVESELVKQIQAGKLPAPDSADETIYEVHFPLSVDPSDGSGEEACYDFCAYHDSYHSNTLGTTGIIAIIPSHMPPGYPSVRDNGTATGVRDCSSCGERSDWFANLSGSISHETIEAITDPDVGLAGNDCSAPLGWYDSNDADDMSYHGEIGDMCEGLADTYTDAQITEVDVSAGTSGSVTVQREWSNHYSACLGSVQDAFMLYGPGQTVRAPAGTSTKMSISTSPTVSGGAASITFEAHSLPDAGVTATFNPATVAAGQATTLTLALTSNVSPNFSFGISAESGAAQAQTVVVVGSNGVTPVLDGGTAGGSGGSGGGSAGGSGGGTAGGSGGGTAGGSGGGTAGGSGGGTAGGSGGGTAGGSGGGTAGGSGGGTAGGSGGGTAGGSGGGTAGGSGGGAAGGSGGGTAGGSGGGSSTGLEASLSPSSLTVTAGSTAQTTLSVTDPGGVGTIAVSASSLAGVTISPSTGTLGTPLALTISAAAGTPSSSGTLELTARVSGASGEVPLALTISGDDATLSTNASISVAPGGSATFTVSSSTSHGNPQLMALSATGLPSGATATFSPAQITSGQSSTGTITVPSTVAGGAVTVTVVGQGPIVQTKATTSLQISGGTSSSGGCAQPGADAIGLALTGLFALARRKRRATLG